MAGLLSRRLPESALPAVLRARNLEGRDRLVDARADRNDVAEVDEPDHPRRRAAVPHDERDPATLGRRHPRETEEGVQARAVDERHSVEVDDELAGRDERVEAGARGLDRELVELSLEPRHPDA